MFQNGVENEVGLFNLKDCHDGVSDAKVFSSDVTDKLVHGAKREMGGKEPFHKAK
jgi:hypothetical protein